MSDEGLGWDEGEEGEIDGGEDSSPARSFTVPDEMGGERADKLAAALAEGVSRTLAKTLILSGNLSVDGSVCADASRKLPAGSVMELVLPPPEPSEIGPEAIPLTILFEDEHLLVIDKPAGLVVHPGAGNRSGTLVNALLHHCAGKLSGIGGVARPGIVHRLDKDTSGLMVAAKTDLAHRSLASQLEDRTLSRKYLALVLGTPAPPLGRVEMAIGRHRTNRLKMAVVPLGSGSGRHAATRYRVERRLGGGLFSLVECALETGRTHQIRVHMAAIGHPLVGDPLYGPQTTALKAALAKSGFSEDLKAAYLGFRRQALHAARISFLHPASGEEMVFEAPVPSDIAELLVSVL